MLWLKNYNDEINKNLLLSPVEKLEFLKLIIDKEAETIVSEIKQNFELYIDLECVNIIMTRSTSEMI